MDAHWSRCGDWARLEGRRHPRRPRKPPGSDSPRRYGSVEQKPASRWGNGAGPGCNKSAIGHRLTEYQPPEDALWSASQRNFPGPSQKNRNVQITRSTTRTTTPAITHPMFGFEPIRTYRRCCSRCRSSVIVSRLMRLHGEHSNCRFSSASSRLAPVA